MNQSLVRVNSVTASSQTSEGILPVSESEYVALYTDWSGDTSITMKRLTLDGVEKLPETRVNLVSTN